MTVVLVHGLLARTLEFDAQWTALARSARLVRYDHRNHGRSERSRAQTSVGTLADDLAAVIEQLAPAGAVVLVGHSMGGMAILALASRHPELFRARVAGVCLLATRAGHYVDGHPVEDTVRWLARHRLLDLPLAVLRAVAPALEQVRPRRTAAVRALTRRFLFGTGDADPTYVAMVQQLLEEPPLSVLSSLDVSVLRHDVVDALPLLGSLPVHIVCGDADALSWPEHGELMRNAIGPSARLTVLPGVGHALNQTRPVEVTAAIEDVLGRARQPLTT